MKLKTMVLIVASFGLTACWNGENVHVSFGDVSVGAQLIDLKTALERDAITEIEYQDSKKALLALTASCREPEGDSFWF
jgi:hypothetical protein